MNRILKYQFHNRFIGVVIAIALDLVPSYGGSYSVWIGTDCVDFGLSLDAAIEVYKNLLK